MSLPEEDELQEPTQGWSLRVSKITDEVMISHPRNGGVIILTKREAFTLAEKIFERLFAEYRGEL